MKRYLLIFIGVLGISSIAHADPQTWGKTKNGAGVTTNEGTLQISSATALANAVATVIASTPTSVTYTGVSDEYNYITDLHIEAYSTGTVVGASIPTICTTTNFPGNPTFFFPTATSIGTVNFYNIDYVFPLRSTTVGTQTTVTCPATGGIRWNIILNYYQDD